MFYLLFTLTLKELKLLIFLYFALETTKFQKPI